MQIILRIEIDVIGSDEFDESDNQFSVGDNMDESMGLGHQHPIYDQEEINATYI